VTDNINQTKEAGVTPASDPVDGNSHPIWSELDEMTRELILSWWWRRVRNPKTVAHGVLLLPGGRA